MANGQMPNMIMPNDIPQSQFTQICISDERDADIIIYDQTDWTTGATNYLMVKLCAP